MVGKHSAIAQRRFQGLPVSLGVVAKRDVDHLTGEGIGAARQAPSGRRDLGDGYLDNVAGLAIEQLLSDNKLGDQ